MNNNLCVADILPSAVATKEIRCAIDDSIRKIAEKYPEILNDPDNVTHWEQMSQTGELEYTQKHWIEFKGEFVAEFSVKVQYNSQLVSISVSEVNFYNN